jgi:hypothetical protein
MSDTRSPDLDERLSERWTICREAHGEQRIEGPDTDWIEVVPAANHAERLAENERARLWIGYAMEEMTAEQITRVTERAEYEGESLLDRVRVLEEALIALAAANDDYLLPDDDGDCCEPLFEKKLIRLSRDYCDEYTTVLTNEGREFIRRALASSLETDTEDGGRDGD